MKYWSLLLCPIMLYLASLVLLGISNAYGDYGGTQRGHNMDRRDASCKDDEFECDDESCIPIGHACDWYLDCEDLSDEGDQCQYAGFKCRSGGTMISTEWLCDGVVDCDDESDEEKVYCTENALISKECPRMSCDNSTRCIAASEICDGTAQCRDGFDESDELCEVGEGICFSCDDDTNCLEWDWVCDEVADCADMSDESSERCGSVYQRCWKGSFLCGHTHYCVPQRWRCDDQDDCGDGTDEVLCDSENEWTGTFEWSEWGAWSECHPACGQGTRSRTRVCDAPRAICPGMRMEEEVCEAAPCLENTDIGCGVKQHLHLRDDGLGLAERVVGGQISETGSWPWQAQLFYRRRGVWSPVCGGTLINPYMVLTAAHCFMGAMNDASRWQVHLGKHSARHEPEPGSQHRLVRKLVLHEGFDEHRGLVDDIAVMVLDAPVARETGRINWACLDDGIMALGSDTECFISGWGVTEMEGKQGSDFLREAKMPIISRSRCNRRDSYGGIIRRSMLCAGHLQGGIDACRGDSGGPLSCLGPDGRWYVVGVTSWGHGCALAKKPGVYSRVSEYADWIASVVEQHFHT